MIVKGENRSNGELHHAIIGRDLLKIDDYFASRGLGNFDNFCCNQPGMIQFFAYEVPIYQTQPDQTALLELDKKAQWMMTMAFFRNASNNPEKK